MGGSARLQESSNEDAGGDGEGDEKNHTDRDENDHTDRMARELMESTALEPSPPPAQGLDGSDARIDGGSNLGGMITPRPADVSEDTADVG